VSDFLTLHSLGEELSRTVITNGVSGWRCASRDEGPIQAIGERKRRGVRLLGAEGALVLYEFRESRIDRAKRVAEEAMLTVYVRSV
jgi:hypothetical protein